MHQGFVLARFIGRLVANHSVEKADEDLLAGLSFVLRNFPDHAVVDGGCEDVCCLIVQGFACVRSDDSRGHVLSVHVPGDLPDLGKLHGAALGLKLESFGPAVVAFIPRVELSELARRSTSIGRALFGLMQTDASILRDTIVNVSGRDALTRTAHLICELYLRLAAVGFAGNGRMDCPFTQVDVGAICGMSAVHANRTLQELRSRKLIQWQSRKVRILDWTKLAGLASFSDAYLHLPTRAAALQNAEATHRAAHSGNRNRSEAPVIGASSAIR